MGKKYFENLAKLLLKHWLKMAQTGRGKPQMFYIQISKFFQTDFHYKSRLFGDLFAPLFSSGISLPILHE